MSCLSVVEEKFEKCHITAELHYSVSDQRTLESYSGLKEHNPETAWH